MVSEKSSGPSLSLTNYLFMQIAVNFKCHKNLSAFQLRKDAFEGIAGVNSIAWCCSFLLSDHGAAAGDSDGLCALCVLTAGVCVPAEHPLPPFLRPLCDKEHLHTLQGRVLLEAQKSLCSLAFRKHFIRRSYFEMILLSNYCSFNFSC